MGKVALVLGGGGVKGLAHITLLKKLDEMGIRPSVIVGTSIGALIGALYAHGLSGEAIEARVREHIINEGESKRDVLKKSKKLLRWMQVFSYERGRGGLLSVDGLLRYLFSEIIDCDFSALEIPLITVATDLYAAKEVAFSTGELLPAVLASMAVPGVFAPVKIEGKTYVDGGVLNNLPCSYVGDGIDCIIASDVISLTTETSLSNTGVISAAINLMIRSASQKQLLEHPADFLFRPNTEGIDAFDFHKIKRILECGEEAMRLQNAELMAQILTPWVKRSV